MNSTNRIAALEARVSALEEALTETLSKNAPILMSDFDEAFSERKKTTIFVDENFISPAFYWLEQLPPDGTTFRWLGKEQQAHMSVSFSRERPIRVTAHLAVYAGDQALEHFRIGCDGQFAKEYVIEKVGQRGATVSAIFPQLPRADSVTQLSLRADWRKDLTDRGDPRTLAVGLNKLVVEQI